MGAAQRLHCVIGSILAHRGSVGQARAASFAANAQACGRLELKGKPAALQVAKFELSKVSAQRAIPLALAEVRWIQTGVNGIAFQSARPPEFFFVQALLSVPPQNAPPVLA